MSEMQRKWGITKLVAEIHYSKMSENHPNSKISEVVALYGPSLC